MEALTRLASWSGRADHDEKADCNKRIRSLAPARDYDIGAQKYSRGVLCRRAKGAYLVMGAPLARWAEWFPHFKAMQDRGPAPDDECGKRNAPKYCTGAGSTPQASPA